MKKGQMFTGDLAVATMLFIATLTLVFLLWDNITEKINSAEQYKEMDTLATDITEQMLRTPGSPIDWNETNVYSIGLADEDRVLNESKLLAFVGMYNTTVRYRDNQFFMNLGPYDFFINFTYLNGTQLVVNETTIATGLAPEGDRITFYRSASLNNETLRIYFTAWNGAWNG